MRKESLKFLEKLLDAPSPSGYEQPAQRVFREYVAPFCDEAALDIFVEKVQKLPNVARETRVKYNTQAPIYTHICKILTNRPISCFIKTLMKLN